MRDEAGSSSRRSSPSPVTTPPRFLRLAASFAAASLFARCLSRLAALASAAAAAAAAEQAGAALSVPPLRRQLLQTVQRRSPRSIAPRQRGPSQPASLPQCAWLRVAATCGWAMAASRWALAASRRGCRCGWDSAAA